MLIWNPKIDIQTYVLDPSDEVFQEWSATIPQRRLNGLGNRLSIWENGDVLTIETN
jgi:hypothetical protein